MIFIRSRGVVAIETIFEEFSQAINYNEYKNSENTLGKQRGY
jgi:hypothetical protein